MSISHGLGIVVGLVFGLIVAAFLIRFCRKKWSLRCKSEYDERQKAAIGKAYRGAFWVTLVLLFLLFLCLQLKLPLPDTDLCIISIAFIGLGVYILGCIMRDAYYGIHDDAKRWSIVIALVGLINFGIGGMNIYESGLRYGLLNFECGLLMLVVLIGIGIRKQIVKHSEEE